MKKHRTLGILVAVALVAAGCGGTKDESGAGGSSQSPVGGSGPSGTQSAPDQVVIDVSVTGDQVAPVNEQLQAKVKQPIVINISSDHDDELHVHSNPEHTFPVKAGPRQTFQFTVDVPGRVDVELHHAEKTIATIAVQ
ncbi:hypothetical protein [Mycobacterium sp. E740]|uniref:hypothetical protein n=1 Tax=Mycobacterium sp. E740 TaxID=1834149 RepID=UPI0007FFD996|nr:hypothetical protein [Mycobacterium sp. E740]OBI82395.1 hypothetical protein A5663_14265 [Mycobacterium sp. E740]